jgi:hypothetical protein
VRGALRLLVLCFVVAAGCQGEGPTKRDSPILGARPMPSIQLERAPRWMGPYCRKAAADLGYAVLCPRQLPHPIDIVPCRGPAPAEELWGEYCFDYALDVLFTGPPGYRGPFAPNRRTGHLAIWTIAPESDFYPDGLYACPGGGTSEEPGRLLGRAGSWWTCPAGKSANLNSGHVAFQWTAPNDVVYGLSVHGVSGVNRAIVGELLRRVALVGPDSG